MSTSSNKQQKKGKDGMGKEGKRKEMVKDWCHTCHDCHAKVEVDVTKYHACHVKRRWMSPSATPATPTAAVSRRSTPAQAHHRSQPSAIRATPATQKWKSMSLPRETKVDVSKCHACHANSRGVPAFHSGPSAPPEPAQCHTCHACHAKWGSMSPSAQCHTCHACHAKVECHQVPRLPRETKVDVSKCHACHANSRGVPAFHSGPSAPPEPAQCHTCHACHAKVEVDVTKYHACHAFLPSFLSSFPPFLLPSFPSSLLTSLLPFCRPSFPPFLLYGHLFFFDASPDQVSQSGAAGAAAVLTSIEGMHPRSEESWWGRWRCSLILQDCRFFDSPWLAFAAPPGCCPGCSYLSQGRSSGWSISFSTSSWA